ncbi:MAG: hypothetical protein FAF03_03750 [Epsilonproteobacteria bacterium]|nr:hypothetical protein [Campylobacterota bacterium]
MKHILLSVLLLSFMGLQTLHADDDEDKKDTYTLEVKHVQTDTEVVVSCDNGYYEKKTASEDEDKLKFKVPKDETCTLEVTTDEPCYKNMKVILDGEDKIDLEDFYTQSCDEDTPSPTPPPDTNTTPPMNGDYILTAWNDLGMHCMDGNDFSVFSVLPQYNNLHAQLKDKNGDLITSGVTITYESTLGTDGQINTSSADKTNFWDYVTDLFGTTLQPDVGLTGNPMSSTTPAPLTFNATHQWWEAEGIPITPYNDGGTKNYYPLVKVIAKDSTGKVLAEVKTVLPVSDEMDCKRCHASTSGNDAKPNAGWVNNQDVEKDYKFNIYVFMMMNMQMQ